MLVGVVSDTHNNIKNVEIIITIFNEQEVDLVIHTGDISKPKTLQLFSKLDCPLIGVFGNNDRIENGLIEVCRKYNFDFREPPFSLTLGHKKVVIFHEPELIEDYLKLENEVDLILHGHTHRYREEVINNIIFFNPGESAGSLKGKNAIATINLCDLEIKRFFF
tara:strand:+ start:1228 stop:1719 length:492 start_codon:yes stop_codon:yes gene_type:complete